MLPFYCLEEVARSIFYALHLGLDDTLLLPRISVILFVAFTTLMCLYLSTLRQMKLFYSNWNLGVFNGNMRGLFDKFDEEGIFVYQLDEQT